SRGKGSQVAAISDAATRSRIRISGHPWDRRSSVAILAIVGRRAGERPGKRACRRLRELAGRYDLLCRGVCALLRFAARTLMATEATYPTALARVTIRGQQHDFSFPDNVYMRNVVAGIFQGNEYP